MSKRRANPVRFKEMTWGDVIAAVKVHGRERVLSVLQGEIEFLEKMQAHLYGGDYDEQHQASQMSAGILKRTETVIRLKNMDDAEMERIWARGTPEEQARLLTLWGAPS